MKTVKQLMEQLAEFDENLPVAIYCRVSEDADVFRKVELCPNRIAHPYVKSDDVYSIYGIDSSQPIVFIR